MRLFYKTVLFVFLCSLSVVSTKAHAAYQTNPAAESKLAGVSLPAGAARVPDDDIPADIRHALAAILEKDSRFIQGGREAIVWNGKSFGHGDSGALRSRVEAGFRDAGWDYEVSGEDSGFTLFSMIRSTPRKRGIFGLWKLEDGALTLAMIEIYVAKTEPGAGHGVGTGNKREASQVPSGAGVFNLAASDQYVNVMKNQMPPLPSFPKLPVKAGKVRGYVKDIHGRPLQGAYIGLRSPIVSRSYATQSAETDANGYYEMEVPWGSAHFWAAGYMIDYGEGRAVVGLHPVDGDTVNHVTSRGAVKNMVLLPYGIANRDDLSQRPWYPNNYYGGSIMINYRLGDPNDMWAAEGSLPEGSTVEVTLTPNGETMDSGAAQSFVIKRPTGGINNFYINNIPLGRYKIAARLSNGKQLNMVEASYGKLALFGLTPEGAGGSGTLLFKPRASKVISGQPNVGAWEAVTIDLKLP